MQTDEDTSVAIVLSGSETNATYSIVTPPAHGSLLGTAPNLFYTPAANFNGTDKFTFQLSNANGQSNIATMTIEVRPVDDAPTANADVYNLLYGTPGQAQQIGVELQTTGVFFIKAPGLLANDSNAVGGTVRARLARGPLHGRLQVRANGSFYYVPNAGFAGVDRFIYQIDNGQGTSSALVTLNIIDRRAPELRFDTPVNGATVEAITKIAGRVRDRESGLKSLTLLWRRFDGAYWNGSMWTRLPVELPLTVQGINWQYTGKLPAPGDNRATDLLDGAYDLRVSATDKSDNVNRVTNRVTVRNVVAPAPTPTLSAVRLSSAGASASQDVIVLRFTGALDTDSASDAMNYAVTVNGVEVETGDVVYGENSVTISGLKLEADDEITLQISALRDAEGKMLKSGTIQLVAR